MNFYFLHNHYIPAKLKNGVHHVKSVIVPEFYPDLNNAYLGDPYYFTSVESYIEYVIQNKYYPTDTCFSIENNKIINPNCCRKTLISYKRLGVKIVQLHCGNDNAYFSRRLGLTYEGERLLAEIMDAGLILDLSHLPDDSALSIANIFQGRITVSHCGCSDLYSSQKPRSNSLTRTSIDKLSKHVELFGVSFLNDIIATSEAELNSEQIFDDIIAQIFLFADTVGADKVALSPDYIDTQYFSKYFHTKLAFPNNLLTPEGLFLLGSKMNMSLSQTEIKKITSVNVEQLLK